MIAICTKKCPVFYAGFLIFQVLRLASPLAASMPEVQSGLRVCWQPSGSWLAMETLLVTMLKEKEHFNTFHCLLITFRCCLKKNTFTSWKKSYSDMNLKWNLLISLWLRGKLRVVCYLYLLFVYEAQASLLTSQCYMVERKKGIKIDIGR